MAMEEQIKELEEEIRKTPYNKATEKHIGLLKGRLARLKAGASKKGGGGGGLGYNVKKTGDATVVFVGFPSVGKSTLINKLTNAASKVAAYEFTTISVVPGMLDYNGAKIQLLDVPGLIEEASAGRGRGREVLSVVRSADLIFVILAGAGWKRQKGVIEKELYNAGMRLNKDPPNIKIVKKHEGGLKIESTVRPAASMDEIKEVFKEFGVLSGDVVIRDPVTIDQLIDCLSGNRIYVPALYILNKSDIYKAEGRLIRISAMKGEGLEELRGEVWKALRMNRIYLKKPGKEADMKEPLIIRGSVTIRDVCAKLNLLKDFYCARIWGPSGKFAGQKYGLEHVLKDGDIVEIHAR